MNILDSYIKHSAHQTFFRAFRISISKIGGDKVIVKGRLFIKLTIKDFKQRIILQTGLFPSSLSLFLLHSLSLPLPSHLFLSLVYLHLYFWQLSWKSLI